MHADVGRADAGSVDRPLEWVGLLLVGDEFALVHTRQRDRDRALEPGRTAQPSEIEIGLSRQNGHHVQSERIVAELGQQSGPGAHPGSRHGPVRHAARRELERVGVDLRPGLGHRHAREDEIAEHRSGEEQVEVRRLGAGHIPKLRQSSKDVHE